MQRCAHGAEYGVRRSWIGYHIGDDAKGCARVDGGFIADGAITRLLAGSGDERLERAGATYSLTAHFLPRELDGIAVERFAILPINYRFTTDAPSCY